MLGVAGLVAVLSKLAIGDPVTTFRHALVLIAALFGSASAVAAALRAVPVQPSLGWTGE